MHCRKKAEEKNLMEKFHLLFVIQENYTFVKVMTDLKKHAKLFQESSLQTHSSAKYLTRSFFGSRK